MLLVMDVARHGSQFIGSIRRSDDQAPVAFWGVLELLAALEHLVPAEPSTSGQPDTTGSGAATGPAR